MIFWCHKPDAQPPRLAERGDPIPTNRAPGREAPGEDPAQPRPLVADLRGPGGWWAVVLGLSFAQIAVHWDSRGVGNYTAVFQFHRRDAEDAEFLTVLAENNHFSAAYMEPQHSLRLCGEQLQE